MAGKVGHFEACCKTEKKKEGTPNHDSSQFCGNTRGKPKYGRMAKCDVRQVTEKTMDKSRGHRDDFYVFSTRNGDAQNTVEMLIQGKLLNVSTESGANFNLMLEGAFEFITETTECWLAGVR